MRGAGNDGDFLASSRSGSTSPMALSVRATKRAGVRKYGSVKSARRRVSAVGAIEAITASPRLSLSASSNVPNGRAWMVQLILISSQISRARSTLKPAGLPSVPV